jgi:hypothetical protein
MPGDVDHVVDAAHHVQIPVLVEVSAVPGEVGAMLEICGSAREGAYLPEWSVKVPS